MKKYLVLEGETYYPSGWSDFVGSYGSLEEARASLKYPKEDRYHWYQIVDTTTALVVEESI